MTDQEQDRLSRENLSRENAYLKLRCAQLQDANDDLGSHVLRLQQQLERLLERRSSPGPPNPLSGGH
jgi:hypothetical protein